MELLLYWKTGGNTVERTIMNMKSIIPIIIDIIAGYVFTTICLVLQYLLFARHFLIPFVVGTEAPFPHAAIRVEFDEHEYLWSHGRKRSDFIHTLYVF